MKTKNEVKRVTFASVQGTRNYQEDRYFHHFFQMNDCEGWLLAIMDGHGGCRAAEVCAEQMGSLFSLDDPEKSEDALRDLVCKLNQATGNLSAGTTLSVACLLESHDKVSVAVLGDSPVVVIDGHNKVHVGPEHNIRTNLKERREAEQRGGYYDDGYIRNVRGEGLQFSRALGDREFGSILSREPEIFSVSSPRWIAVASDGMLDPAHYDSGLLQEFIQLGKDGADATRLLDWACRPGHVLGDNASVVVWKA